MEEFGAHRFVSVGRLLERVRSHYKQRPQKERLPEDEKAALVDFATELKEVCQEINLRLSVLIIERLVSDINEGAESDSAELTNRGVSDTLREIERRIRDEMKLALFFYVPHERAEFYQPPQPLFGKAVADKLSKANEDIDEAGKCIALGRFTASVFHLMRVMELGVQQFGKKLGVTFTADKVWQTILNEADAAIKARNQRLTTTKRLAAISSHLYNVKLAWRNEVMHPKATYTEEEAKDVFTAVNRFINDLVK